MKVILLQDVAKVGRKNEVKEVSDGFARNNLFPQKKALPATNENLARIKAWQKGKTESGQRKDEVFALLTSKLKGQTVVCSRPAGPEGHLFAGLHEKDLSAILSKESGQVVEVAWISVARPIKTLGEHKITLRRGESDFECTLLVEKAK